MQDQSKLLGFFQLLASYKQDESTSIHATKILALIPELISNPSLSNVQLGAAHAELYITIPNHQSVILIWGEKDNLYRISIMKPDTSIERKRIVTSDVLPKTIEEYIAIVERNYR